MFASSSKVASRSSKFLLSFFLFLLFFLLLFLFLLWSLSLFVKDKDLLTACIPTCLKGRTRSYFVATKICKLRTRSYSSIQEDCKFRVRKHPRCLKGIERTRPDSVAAKMLQVKDGILHGSSQDGMRERIRQHSIKNEFFHHSKQDVGKH